MDMLGRRREGRKLPVRRRVSLVLEKATEWRRACTFWGWRVSEYAKNCAQ